MTRELPSGILKLAKAGYVLMEATKGHPDYHQYGAIAITCDAADALTQEEINILEGVEL